MTFNNLLNFAVGYNDILKPLLDFPEYDYYIDPICTTTKEHLEDYLNLYVELYKEAGGKIEC